MADDPSPQRTVTLLPCSDGWAVTINPPLPDGDQRQWFHVKDWAWTYAMQLWTEHRAAFDDKTDARAMRGSPA